MAFNRHKPRPGAIDDAIFARNSERFINQVATLLRVELNRQGISTTDAGALRGQTKRTVSRLINGSDSKLSTVADIATVLGKRLRIEFIDDEETAQALQSPPTE